MYLISRIRAIPILLFFFIYDSICSAASSYSIGQEGFHTLIYLYDGRMVGMSELGSIEAMASLWCFQLLLVKTTRPYDHRR